MAKLTRPGYQPQAVTQRLRDEISRLHSTGMNDREMAKELGVTAAYVNLHRRAMGLPTNHYRYSKKRNGKNAELYKSDIIEAYKHTGLVEQVAEAFSDQVTRLQTRRFLREYRDKNGLNFHDLHEHALIYTDKELIDCLREAATFADRSDLPHLDYTAYARYRQFADGRPWPGHQALQLRFGSWREARKKAGLAEGKRLGPQKQWSEERCWDTITNLVHELGHIPTVMEYDTLAREREDLPSVALMRRRLGGWKEIREHFRKQGWR